jgi:hypothetical protein
VLVSVLVWALASALASALALDSVLDQALALAPVSEMALALAPVSDMGCGLALAPVSDMDCGSNRVVFFQVPAWFASTDLEHRQERAVRTSQLPREHRPSWCFLLEWEKSETKVILCAKK